MPNECIWSRLSFDIYFSMFCENHTCQSLSQNDTIYSRIFENWVLFLGQNTPKLQDICNIANKIPKNKKLQNYFITQII